MGGYLLATAQPASHILFDVVGVILVAFGLGVIAASIYSGHAYSKLPGVARMATGAFRTSGTPSRRASDFRPNPVKVLVSIVIAGLAFVGSHSVVVAAIYITAAYISGSLISVNVAANLSTDMHRILSFAQLVFPAMRTTMQPENAIRVASTVLSPKEQEQFNEVLANAARARIRPKLALLRFAAETEQQIVQVVFGLIAAAVSAGDTGLTLDSADKVVDILRELYDSFLDLSDAGKSNIRIAKVLSYFGLGVSAFVMVALGSAVPNSWSGGLGVVIAIMIGVVSIVSALMIARWSRPPSFVQLVELDKINAIIEREAETTSRLSYNTEASN